MTAHTELAPHDDGEAVTRFTGRVVLVTGAGSGVGAHLARFAAAKGAAVGVLDVDPVAAERTARDIVAERGRACAVAADVRDRTAVAAAVADVVTELGQVDVLIANAGAAHSFTPFDEIDDHTRNRVLDVNLWGVLHSAAAVAPAMRQQRSGTIVVVTSVAGQRARRGLAVYCAAKAAAISLTQTMALELAPHGIRVNALAPGAIDTPMFPEFLGPGTDEATRRSLYDDVIPLGRIANPAEIARAALFLASPDASFVTGHVLTVDGGRAL